MISFNIRDNVNIDAFVNDTIDNVDRKFIQAGAMMVASAKQLAPVNTGHLRRNIVMKRKAKLHVEVLSPTNYSAYLEYGTGIYSTNGLGRQTSWVYNSRGRFYRTHGTRPHPFFFNSYDLAKDWLLSELR